MAPRLAARRCSHSPVVPAFALFFLIGACGSPEPVVDGQPAPRRVLTDANVTSIATAANNGEIGEGQLALSRSRNQQVREFAQQMISDHTALNQQIMHEAQRTGMQPEELTSRIQATSEQTLRSLGQREGAAFDRAYIANQVAMHRWLLETMDNTLIPAARDDRLESLLRSQRAIIADHLEHALRVQQSLGQH